MLQCCIGIRVIIVPAKKEQIVLSALRIFECAYLIGIIVKKIVLKAEAKH